MERTVLRQSSDKRRRIVVEGLNSADGGYAPLDRVTEPAEDFGFFDKVDVVVATMNKSLDSIGGFALTLDWFEREPRYMSPSYTSSVELAEIEAAFPAT
jgi:8-amino-7-oxononanoate synthase